MRKLRVNFEVHLLQSGNFDVLGKAEQLWSLVFAKLSADFQIRLEFVWKRCTTFSWTMVFILHAWKLSTSAAWSSINALGSSFSIRFHGRVD